MIRVDKLSYKYPQAQIFHQFSLNIPAGSMTAILGPNGAGKSTLLKLFAGVITPAAGEVLIDDQRLDHYSRKSLARRVSFVPQHFSTAFDFTAYQIAGMGRFPYQAAFSPTSDEDRKIIKNAMQETDVWHLRERKISQLSGGEKQRLILASALAQEPEVLLLDEPVTAMDIQHQLQFCKLLQRFNTEKSLTIVAVLHDLNLASRFFEQLIFINEGQIAAHGPPAEVLTPGIIEAVYGIKLSIHPHPADGKPYFVLP